MTYISSPIAYPPSSSPPEASDSKKRPATTDLDKTKKKRLFTNHFKLPSVKNIKDGHSAPQSIPLPSKTGNNPFGEDELSGAVPDAAKDSVVASKFTTEISSLSKEVNSDSGEFGDSYAPTTRVCLSSAGERRELRQRATAESVSYERLIAQRAVAAPGKAKSSYYGIEIHRLLKEAKEAKPLETKQEEDFVVQSVEAPRGKRKQRHTMWTEKYRARKFTDLVGDERTHRAVLRWLKAWDSIVFPGAAVKPKINTGMGEESEERAHRKILLMTGPPGLGKTTLAHVCARQAGYEVVEVNASDERNRDVVKGKIRDCVGTENVRGMNSKIGKQTVRKAGRPVCVVVDEVDGVVTGSSGGGEGGFIKALIDLILLDQKNSKSAPTASFSQARKKKGDAFRLLRPMILICNDVYHPSLRPLRSSGLAEILHVRKPPLDKVISRMKAVFEKEGLQVENDGVRRLCEATWGIAGRKEGRSSGNTGEGDMRGVLVAGEWAASKLRYTNRSATSLPRLTRHWVETQLLSDLNSSGSGARGVGRGGIKETVDRIFLEGGGFPENLSSLSTDEQPIPSVSVDDQISASSSVSAPAKPASPNLLRPLIDTTGEHDRVTTDLFIQYPTRHFQDDTFLSKPNTAYDWLLFHDSVSSRVHQHQDWELAGYLPQAALAFHQLFASSSRPLGSDLSNSNSNTVSGQDHEDADEESPFSGPRADFAYHDSHRATLSLLQSLHSSLSLPLHRMFRSAEELATDLLPHVNRMLAPDVKPVLVGGSGESRGTASVRREGERAMVKRSAQAMLSIGVDFERVRVEDEGSASGRFGGAGSGGWVYRVEP